MRRKGRRLALAAGTLGLAVLGLTTYLAWPHLLFWYRFAPLGLNAQGYREYRHRQTGIVFVRLPGGKFWMGAQKADPKGQNYDPEAEDNEGPVHEVTLSPFFIGKYEVTEADWWAVMETHQSGIKSNHEGFPIELATWDILQNFLAKTGFRLPTEAQWEFACRGLSPAPIAGTGILDDMGWCEENSQGAIHPVGKKGANGFGLHDTHGNVLERCEDVYDAEFYSKPEASEMNPICRANSEDNVFRGGSFADSAKFCRSASRDTLPPGIRNYPFSFRPAYPAP